MLRFYADRGWFTVTPSGKEVPYVSDATSATVRQPKVSEVQLLDQAIGSMERSGKFLPAELATLKTLRDKWWTATTPATETPLKTGDVVWVSGEAQEGSTGHASMVRDALELAKVKIPGGFSVENVVDLLDAGTNLGRGARMMYVAPGTTVDTAWPEFQFLARPGGRRARVVRLRRLRGVESHGFFVPVPAAAGPTWPGDNVWSRLVSARMAEYGPLPSQILAPTKPKLPKIRKSDFRLRFRRDEDGFIAVSMQRRVKSGWTPVATYLYDPESK